MIQRCLKCRELLTLACFDEPYVCCFCTEQPVLAPSLEEELIQLRNKLALSDRPSWHNIAQMLDQILTRHHRG